jgi:hypothetical protein
MVAPLTSQTLVHAQDPLPSWNDGTAKQAILAFVKEVTEKSSSAINAQPLEKVKLATLPDSYSRT